jgi:ATP-binding protein involved in chromosome partitioning
MQVNRQVYRHWPDFSPPVRETETILSTDIQTRVLQILAEHEDPYREVNLAETGVLTRCVLSGSELEIDLTFPYAMAGMTRTLVKLLKPRLEALRDVSDAFIRVLHDVPVVPAREGTEAIPRVRQIVCVASGKGGVGKSTTAVNLTLALHAEGARVGLLDADIYGPSQALMLGVQGQKPTTQDGKTFDPVIAHGIPVMSMAFLLTERSPTIWRGPMVSGAFTQMLRQTNWGDLDYLVIDLPPGTGDIQLTLSQQVPVNGAVVVTTPQDIALLDARRGIEMFRRVQVPVLGVVENMSLHRCSQCGHTEHLFGEGGGDRIAAEYDTELLGALPLDLSIREQTDRGRPSVISDPDGPVASAYRDIARRVGARLARFAAEHSRSGLITKTQGTDD